MKQWLPKIVSIINENTTELNKNRMKPVLDVDADLDDDNGTLAIYVRSYCMYTYILLLIYIVGNLTIKVLFALTYMVKDHKTY